MNVQEQQKELCKAIEIYLRKWIKNNNGNYDYHMDGLITVKNNNTYNVKINGQEYTNIPCQTGLNFNVDDRVDVMARNGNSSQMKIVDKLFW